MFLLLLAITYKVNKNQPIFRVVLLVNSSGSFHFGNTHYQRILNYQGILGSSTFLGLSPSTPPYHRCSNHLPGLAKATVGPEDVVFVLVTAPVLVGSGASASAVLREGGGGIDVTGEEKKGCPKDLAGLLSRIGSLCQSALFIEDPCHSSGNHLLIPFPIHSETPWEKVILPFFG